MKHYCTSNDVLRFLGLQQLEGIDVEHYIQLAEAEIEALSYTCFAGKECISDLETHSITTPLGRFWWGAGVPIHLRHRPVKRILRFEVFRGGTWQDIRQFEG
ncbi:MAG: hypothetical protein QXY39_03505, partial [Thermofilaceae archaeon]